MSRRVRSRALLAALASLTLLAGCGRLDPTRPPLAGSMTAPDGSPAVIITADRSNWPHDVYTFHRMSLTGDRLRVEISYGGGCETHEFALLVDPAFMESHPVQLRGSLAHDANGDMCRALLSRTLVLDLTPIRELWRRSYGARSGTVILRIDGWPQAVEYVF